MNLKQLEFAVALAEERNFTRAAQRCHIVQSALSHQIARLEEELGALLFERLPRHVRVTPAGDAFLAHARRALESVRRIHEDVAAVTGEVRGSLAVGKISSLTTVDLVDVLADFHQQFPQVDIRLRMDMSEILLQDVRERRLDLAFVGLLSSDPVEGVAYRVLAEEELVSILPEGHPLSGRERLRLDELADLPLVDFQAGSSARRQTSEAFAALGLPHRVRFEISHMSLLEKFVCRGLAVGLVPATIAQGFRQVVRIPVCDAPVRRVYVVWQTMPTPAAQAFLSTLDRALESGKPA